MKKTIKTFIRWLGSNAILATPRIYIGKSLAYYYAGRGKVIFDLATFARREDSKGLALVKQVKAETTMLLEDQEAYLIYLIVKRTAKIDGDIAEVGAYNGGSAKIISEATTHKAIHLFDTFEGLPELSADDSSDQFQKGNFSASLEQVKEYLKKYSNVFFYKGLFPDTAGPVVNMKFSFVHLDVDIYQSTLDCLNFFYPRMSKGGIIISHDYPRSKGVKKAVDEFFADKSEIIIEPFTTGQCLIIKV